MHKGRKSQTNISCHPSEFSRVYSTRRCVSVEQPVRHCFDFEENSIDLSLSLYFTQMRKLRWKEQKNQLSIICNFSYYMFSDSLNLKNLCFAGPKASRNAREVTRSTSRVRRRTVLTAPPTSGPSSAPSSTTNSSGVINTSKLQTHIHEFSLYPIGEVESTERLLLVTFIIIISAARRPLLDIDLSKHSHSDRFRASRIQRVPRNLTDYLLLLLKLKNMRIRKPFYHVAHNIVHSNQPL